MNTLYMKIHQYDEESKTLIVSFASDTTQHQDPDVYRAYAFDVVRMWPDIEPTNLEEIKKRIAVAGVYHAEQQEKEENFVADPVGEEQYKQLIGGVFSYPIAELIPPAPSAEDFQEENSFQVI